MKYNKKDKNSLLLENIDKSIIDVLYEEREDKLYMKNVEDKANLEELTKNTPITYGKLINAIKNLPPHFGNTREYILETLEGYMERQNVIVSYENERFYKSGFCDGINLIIEALQKKEK